MINYIKIPREIIYSTSLGDKRVIVYSYLYSRRALDDTVAFSITELCHWSHLKPNYHDGKINQKYLEILLLLSRRNYFDSSPDFRELLDIKRNSNEYYNIALNVCKFDVEDNFAIIYLDELQRILNFKEELQDSDVDLSRMSSAYILLVLSYIRVNINHNQDQPRCCYRLYRTISEETGLSERYIGRVVEILDAMNIIAYKESKRIRYLKDNGKYGFSSAPKVFADYRCVKNGVADREYDYREEIEKQLKILEQNTS